MKKLIYFLFFTILILNGCSKETLVSPSIGSKTYGKVAINIDKTNTPSDVSIIVFVLNNANSDSLKDFVNVSSDSSASITFKNVNVGVWDLRVSAEDINGTVLYKGESTVVVDQGITTEVVINLIPVQNGTGNIEITVNWGTIKLGNAIYLDGVSGYVEVPNSQSLSSIDTAITIEAWVKPAQQYYNTIVCKGLSNYGVEFAQVLSPGIFLNGVTAQNADYYWGRIMVPNTFVENQWSHIAVTYSSSTGVKAYLNGNLIYIVPGYGNIQPGNVPLRIGARVDSIYTEYFKGGLDEVRIWNVVRTQSQIALNMNKELTGNESGLVAYWKFNETPGSGTIIHDSTPNHNDGLIHGNVYLANHNNN